MPLVLSMEPAGKTTMQRVGSPLSFGKKASTFVSTARYPAVSLRIAIPVVAHPLRLKIRIGLANNSFIHERIIESSHECLYSSGAQTPYQGA